MWTSNSNFLFQQLAWISGSLRNFYPTTIDEYTGSAFILLIQYFLNNFLRIDKNQYLQLLFTQQKKYK